MSEVIISKDIMKYIKNLGNLNELRFKVDASLKSYIDKSKILGLSDKIIDNHIIIEKHQVSNNTYIETNVVLKSDVPIVFYDKNIDGSYSDIFKGISIKSIYLENTTIRSLAHLFTESGVEFIDFTGCIFENIDNMRATFSLCKSLRRINFANIDTSNISDFKSAFSNCKNLKTINNFKLNTMNGLNFENMIYNCNKLKYIGGNEINLSKAKNLKNMICGTHIKNLRLVLNSDTELTHHRVQQIIKKCYSLKELEIDVLGIWNITQINNIIAIISTIANKLRLNILTINVNNIDIKEFANCLRLHNKTLCSINGIKMYVDMNKYAKYNIIED